MLAPGAMHNHFVQLLLCTMYENTLAFGHIGHSQWVWRRTVLLNLKLN